jgi:hypothetical protein
MRGKNIICCTILGFIFILVGNAQLAAEQIYTWTDKDGNMHITEYPPPEGAKLKEVTSYSKKAEVQTPDIGEPQKGSADDLKQNKKSKETEDAQRKADAAAKKTHKANVKASEAVLKAYEIRDKRKGQGRNERDRLIRQDVRKAEKEATRAMSEAEKGREEAKKAREKTKISQ